MADGLVFATYLGPNTTVPAEALALVVASSLQIPVRHVTAPPDARADITWACGLLTAQGIHSGRLDLDIVAAPVFPGEPGPVYRSVIVTRREAPSIESTTLFAVNQADSWSGHHALRVHMARPIRTVETGSHVDSVAAVRVGSADAAAIDSSVWAYLIDTDPSLAGELVVVDRTIDWPAPPFAVARRSGARMRDAIVDALVNAAVPGLTAVVPARATDYDALVTAAGT